MTREEKIAYLIDDDRKLFMSCPEMLDSVLLYGFKGYDEYTNDEIEAALFLLRRLEDDKEV